MRKQKGNRREEDDGGEDDKVDLMDFTLLGISAKEEQKD